MTKTFGFFNYHLLTCSVRKMVLICLMQNIDMCLLYKSHQIARLVDGANSLSLKIHHNHNKSIRMQIPTEEAINEAVAQWNGRLSKFRKYWKLFIIISFHICIMNISFIDILKNFKRFGQPYTHGDHVPNGCPRKFHRVFSDIKFYVNQTIFVSCAGVMWMYSPGFSIKTT